MSYPPTPAGRVRNSWLAISGLAYAWFASAVAVRAAYGLTSGDWYGITGQVLLVFLLVLGYVVLSRAGRTASPLSSIGLVRRAGEGREFAVGAATGWSLLLVAVLPSVFIGGLSVHFWSAGHQWLLLAIDALVLLVSALAQELIFRGYPFQRMVGAIGPGLASVLMSAVFAAVHFNPDAPRPAVLVSFLLSAILCVAYLRTRALWLPWGLHFAWNAATGLLFGLPVSGSTRFSPVVQTDALGPLGWTGGDYGPEGSTFAFFVALAGLLLIRRVTREYAFVHAQPVIVAAGIPVDLDAAARRQHEAATRPAAPVPAAEPRLVQIGGAQAAQTAPGGQSPAGSRTAASESPASSGEDEPEGRAGDREGSSRWEPVEDGDHGGRESHEGGGL